MSVTDGDWNTAVEDSRSAAPQLKQRYDRVFVEQFIWENDPTSGADMAAAANEFRRLGYEVRQNKLPHTRRGFPRTEDNPEGLSGPEHYLAEEAMFSRLRHHMKRTVAQTLPTEDLTTNDLLIMHYNGHAKEWKGVGGDRAFEFVSPQFRAEDGECRTTIDAEDMVSSSMVVGCEVLWLLDCPYSSFFGRKITENTSLICAASLPDPAVPREEEGVFSFSNVLADILAKSVQDGEVLHVTGLHDRLCYSFECGWLETRPIQHLHEHYTEHGKPLVRLSNLAEPEEEEDSVAGQHSEVWPSL